MGYDIPTREPTSHRAGDTLKFTRSYADFPADTWTLTYWITGQDTAPISFSATASAKDYSISVAKATTATWIAGTYKLTGYVDDGTDRHQVYQGDIEILPDLTVDVNADTRSYAKRMLDLIEAQLLTGIPDTAQSYSINGRSFTVKSNQDLLFARGYFKAEVNRENAKGENRKIQIRFVSAR